MLAILGHPPIDVWAKAATVKNERPLRGTDRMEVKAPSRRRKKIRAQQPPIGTDIMLKSVEGIYRDGKVELLETPPDVGNGRVIVTFLPANRSRTEPPKLTTEELADLRWKLASWEEDWNAPGMEAYDDL
jgi:hypothetical protein